MVHRKQRASDAPRRDQRNTRAAGLKPVIAIMAYYIAICQQINAVCSNPKGTDRCDSYRATRSSGMSDPTSLLRDEYKGTFAASMTQRTEIELGAVGTDTRLLCIRLCACRQTGQLCPMPAVLNARRDRLSWWEADIRVWCRGDEVITRGSSPRTDRTLKR